MFKLKNEPAAKLAASESVQRTNHAILAVTIAEQKNGTPISLLSALARKGYDPWQQAEQLAELPPDQAQEVLVRLLNEIFERNTFSESHEMTQQLIQLVPRKQVLHTLKLDVLPFKRQLPQLGYWLFWIAFVALLSLLQPRDRGYLGLERSPSKAGQDRLIDNSLGGATALTQSGERTPRATLAGEPD